MKWEGGIYFIFMKREGGRGREKEGEKREEGEGEGRKRRDEEEEKREREEGREKRFFISHFSTSLPQRPGIALLCIPPFLLPSPPLHLSVPASGWTLSHELKKKSKAVDKFCGFPLGCQWGKAKAGRVGRKLRASGCARRAQTTSVRSPDNNVCAVHPQWL